MEAQSPLDFIFLQRIFNYGPVATFIHKLFEIYGSLKKNPTFKVFFDKAEYSLEFIQAYLPDFSSAIQKNSKFLNQVDQFSCRQLDNIEFGIEKTREILDKDMMTNMKNVSSSLAENGKLLVQERVVKPVGGPVKDYIDTQVEMISEKLKAPEVQEKIAPIQEFVVDKAHYVHDQIENNSQFEAIKPHYERALAQVTQVVENLTSISQAEEESLPVFDNQDRSITETPVESQLKSETASEIETAPEAVTEPELAIETKAAPESETATETEPAVESEAAPESETATGIETVPEIEKATETASEVETEIFEEDEADEATNFNYLRYNMTLLKHSL